MWTVLPTFQLYHGDLLESRDYIGAMLGENYGNFVIPNMVNTNRTYNLQYGRGQGSVVSMKIE